PLFIQVAETIKSRIINHEYSPGDSIPSAKDLEIEFNVSNITIRRSIEKLTRGGYLIPKRGMRALVAEQTNEIVEMEITGNFRTWINTALGRGLKVTAEIIDRQVLPCPEPIRKILSLDPGEKVERIKRVRKLRGIPISYFVNYGPSRLLTQLSSQEIETHTFLDIFQKVCKIKLKSMEQKVQASSADMDLADILYVDFGFPLFFVQNVYYSDKGLPMAITNMHYRSDKYVYTAKMNF
ncbi:MAG: GntR family transcriptional regulator, partial [Proteobacteria bacterium]|nr:GntR family transcriptional regulator [Pseudomonadota bacterium]